MVSWLQPSHSNPFFKLIMHCWAQKAAGGVKVGGSSTMCPGVLSDLRTSSQAAFVWIAGLSMLSPCWGMEAILSKKRVRQGPSRS